jgi:single-strand DNA-binding protein
MSLNKVMLIGRLGVDPELRYTQGGQAVCSFRMATTERYKSGEEWQERTEWHRIVVWGRQGENAAEYLAKGREVFIEGRLQTRKWQDKSGADRYTTEIVATNVQFLGGGKRDGQGGSDYPPPPGDNDFANSPAIAEDDDIPF